MSFFNDWFRELHLTKFGKFKHAKEKNYATLMQIYHDANMAEKNYLKYSGYLDKSFLASCAKEELIKLSIYDLIDDDILLELCKETISFKDILAVKPLSSKTIFKSCTNKEIYQDIKLLLNSEEFGCMNFELEYEFKNNIKMKFYRRDFYHGPSKSCIVFEHNGNVYFINQSDVLSVALYDYKILINGVSSEFQFAKDDDLSGLTDILFYLNKKGVENKKNLREFFMSKQDNQKEQSDIVPSKESFNPWIAGGLGFLLGASIAD